MKTNIKIITSTCRLVFLTTLICCTPALAGDDESVARGTSPYLIDAGQIGSWSENGKSGFIRYLVFRGGHEEVRTVLYVQWIEESESEETGDEKQVLSTVEIIPIPGLFDSPKIVSSNPYVLHIEIGSTLCTGPQKFNIKLTGVGKYELNYLNKTRCEWVNDGTK